MIQISSCLFHFFKLIHTLYLQIHNHPDVSAKFKLTSHKCFPNKITNKKCRAEKQLQIAFLQFYTKIVKDIEKSLRIKNFAKVEII